MAKLRIKEILKEKGMTMDNLKNRMGMNNLSALSQSVNGNPTLERIGEFAAALGVPITELFERPQNGGFTCPSCGATFEVEIRMTGEPCHLQG